MTDDASTIRMRASCAAPSGFENATKLILSAALALFVFQSNGARADDCTPNNPVSYDVVTCSSNNGVDVDNFAADPGVHFLDITVESDATIDGVGTTFEINDDNTFNNDGTIAAGVDGILGGDRNTINNENSIEGSDDAIEMGSDTTVNNNGTIIGGDNAILITGGGTNTIDNDGILTGTNHSVLGGAGVENVMNRTGATINGDMDLAGGNDSLTLETGSILSSSAVDGGDGTDGITLDGAGTFGGGFTNFESLTKQGSGIWSLGGTSDVVSTAIDGGTLAVNGMLTTTMTIGASGTLAGAGTVDGNVANNGGTVSPGNSIETLTVNGDYTENAPSLLSIEIDDAGNHDRLYVLGTATLDPGSTLDVVPLAGDYTLGGDIFDVLVADGGLVGSFGTATASGETKLYLEYQSDRVQLTSFATIFGPLGETPNHAVRLEGLARPNTVVISPVTAQLAQRLFVLGNSALTISKAWQAYPLVR